jgi:hypothetical protein
MLVSVEPPPISSYVFSSHLHTWKEPFAVAVILTPFLLICV